MVPEDSVERQQTAGGYVLDCVDEMKGEVPLPDNSLLDLAEQYLRADGDYAGVVIGAIWASGKTPDAPDED